LVSKYEGRDVALDPGAGKKGEGSRGPCRQLSAPVTMSRYASLLSKRTTLLP